MIRIQDLCVSYGDRPALQGVSLDVAERELFALLGPNGGGKSTLFKVLTTALPPDSGRAEIGGHDVTRDPARVRAQLGVVFQSPSLDPRLTVRENLWHQGHMYGLTGKELGARIDAALEQVGLSDRRGERADHLSGGQQRRVEIAKSVLHRPAVLLLDEPSTGLDPGARRDLRSLLGRLRDETGVTVLLTTHLLDEAEHCDRVGILDTGKLVALDRPAALMRAIEGDVVTVQAADLEALAGRIHGELGAEARAVDGSLRIERPDGPSFVAELMRTFPDEITSVTVGHPTLEDVFIHMTGRTLWDGRSAGAIS